MISNIGSLWELFNLQLTEKIALATEKPLNVIFNLS